MTFTRTILPPITRKERPETLVDHQCSECYAYRHGRMLTPNDTDWRVCKSGNTVTGDTMICHLYR